jgi:hypothetical protein
VLLRFLRIRCGGSGSNAELGAHFHRDPWGAEGCFLGTDGSCHAWSSQSNSWNKLGCNALTFGVLGCRGPDVRIPGDDRTLVGGVFQSKIRPQIFKERNNESVAIEGSGICRYTFWHVVVIVLASFLLIGGLSTLAMTLMHAPFWFLGFSLRGTSAASVELIYAGVAIYCGIGLFRRSRMAFKTAIVLQVICLLSSCIALAPGATRQLWATSLEMNQRLGLAANPQFAESHSALIRIIQVFTLALISFWLYVVPLQEYI